MSNEFITRNDISYDRLEAKFLSVCRERNQLEEKLRARMKYEENKDYKTIHHLILALCEICAADPKKIIDLLTGYMWDEKESNELIKLIEIGTNNEKPK